MKNLILIALIGFQTLLYGQYSGGDGTSGNPFQIATTANLITLSKTSSHWGKYFIQTTNIDFGENEQAVDWDGDGSATWDTEDKKGFSPIGPGITYFTGSYNGNGHTISNLYINRSDSFVGLFGVVLTGGKIENLGVVACNITGGVSSTTGGLAGQNNNGSSTITNCYSTGSVSGNNTVGGLVGYNNSSIPITDCYSTCNVSGTHYIGGLVGYNNSTTVSNSYSTGVVNGTGTYIGGLIGYNYSSAITNCYCSGNVYGANYVGGLVGANDISSSVNNCYSFSDVTRVSGNSTIVGGFCGYNFNSTITYCYSIGDVIYSGATNPTDKGFVGNTIIAYTANFFDSNASNQTTANGATPKTTAEMKTETTFTDVGWNFTTIWDIDGTTIDGYPFLLNNAPVLPTAIWDGSESTAWNTAANWDGNAIPTSGYHVIIPNVANDPIITSGVGANCRNLTVNTDAVLTINSGGSLINTGTISNNGIINIEKSLSNETWHLISSPIGNAKSNVFDGNYLQNWSEPTATWIEIISPDIDLTPGKGFSLWGVDKTSNNYTFTGIPNTGNVPIGISFTAVVDSTNDGANLLGNPYPSYLDWNLVVGFGAKYTWNGTGYDSFLPDLDFGEGSRYLEPMQGFFIVIGSTGTFSFTNNMRTHTSSKKSVEEKALQNGLVLSAAGNNYEDNLWLVLDEQAIEGFELQNDAFKFTSNTPGISQLWSKCTDGNLSIDVRPETETIQLGFTNDQNGNYSIALNQIDGIAKAELEDTKTSVFHNLLSAAYSFNWNTTDSEERFILHLKATRTDDLEAQTAQVYAANHRVYVRMSELNSYSEMAVYDLSGRVILAKPLAKSSLQSFELNQPSGAYLVQIKGESGTKSYKVVL